MKKILNEDPLGILKVRVTEVVTIDQRLKDSFNEINNFIDNYGREPKESKDIFERKLYVRLNQLRKDFDKAKILKEFDKHNLLVDVKDVETIEDIFCTCILEITNFYEENTTNIPAYMTAHISTIIYIGDIIHNPFLTNYNSCSCLYIILSIIKIFFNIQKY